MLEYTRCPKCREDIEPHGRWTDRIGLCGCSARVWRRLHYRRSDRQGYYTSPVMPLTGGVSDAERLALERAEAARHVQSGSAEAFQPAFWPVQQEFRC